MGTRGGGDAGGPGNGADRDRPGDPGRDPNGAGKEPGDELTGLPAEWGIIVIPDDPSALAEEAARVRAELQARRRPRWRRRQWSALRPAVRLPALLLTVAVVAAFAGLFTLGYGGRRGANPDASANAGVGTDAGPDATSPGGRVVPALDLLDPTGRVVALRSLLPAVILLTEGCACDDLVIATDLAAPPGSTVLVVARTAPPVPVAARHRVRAMADPAGELRAFAGLPTAADRAGVLLATRSAEIVRSVPAAASVDAFRADLDALAGPPTPTR